MISLEFLRQGVKKWMRLYKKQGRSHRSVTSPICPSARADPLSSGSVRKRDTWTLRQTLMPPRHLHNSKIPAAIHAFLYSFPLVLSLRSHGFHLIDFIIHKISAE